MPGLDPNGFVMSLRIRADGRILCAAMHGPEPDDTYIDDGLHYTLSVECKVLVTEEMDEPGGRGGHRAHGQWWWRGSVPPDVLVAAFYLPQHGGLPRRG